jgi:4-amino-4-deoxy-L-arabinose transferase-like glycosyltransferase
VELILFALGAVFRLAAMFAWGESFVTNPTQDPDAYVLMARHWRYDGIYSRDGVHPTAYRPPGMVSALWPIVTADGINLFGMVTIHTVVGVGTTLLAVRLAKRVGAGDRSWMAGLVAAIDPLLVGQSALIMSEPLFTLLMTAGLLGSLKRSFGASSVRVGFEWGLTGLAWGLAGLTRPIAWPILVWATVFGLFTGRRRLATVSLVVALVVAVPWVIRNQSVLGKPILTTTHGGYTLWLGQNPNFYESVVKVGGVVWPEEDFRNWTDANESLIAGKGEIEQDRILREQAVGWMRSNPAAAWQTVGHHLSRFWALWPARVSMRAQTIVAIYFGSVFVLAIVGIIRCRSIDGVLLWGVPIIFSLVHALYWSDMRMRAPLAPILGVAIALAFVPRGSAKLDRRA